MGRTYDVVTSFAVSTARAGAGWFVRSPGPRPTALLELYEFEACPFCRKVREAITVLDLDVLIRPCPQGGTRFRPEAEQIGGKAQFPLLIDPDGPEGRLELLESNDINAYLFRTYGRTKAPLRLRAGPLTDATSGIASLARMRRGRRARPSRAPDAPLELWGFEASPYTRIVREVLCELELPYVLRTLGRGSHKRPGFRIEHGKIQVPYLVDPNTQTSMFESADIVDYLEQAYAL